MTTATTPTTPAKLTAPMSDLPEGENPHLALAHVQAADRAIEAAPFAEGVLGNARFHLDAANGAISFFIEVGETGANGEADGRPEFERITMAVYDAMPREAQEAYDRRYERRALEEAVRALQPLAVAIRPLENPRDRGIQDTIHWREKTGTRALTVAGVALVGTCRALAEQALEQFRGWDSEDVSRAWYVARAAYVQCLAFENHPEDEVMGPEFGDLEGGVWAVYERLTEKLEA